MAQDVQNNGVEVASYVDAIRRCSDGTLREVRDMIVHLARDTVTDSAASSRRRFMEAVEIAQGLGIDVDDLEHYGKYKAKLPLKLIDADKVAKSKLVMSILRLPVCSDFSKEV